MSSHLAEGQEFGRFRIVRLIGRGGMGAVYEAHDPRLDRSVALKLVLPEYAALDEFRLRFEREARALARMRSQHVVTIHEVGELDGMLYLVTEYLPDGDLQSWLERHGRLSSVEALRLAAELAEALYDAHQVGVVHRDVKPANVLVWPWPEGLVAFLCDFGIAADAEASGGQTKTGMMIGSLAYMAPERHLGHPADARGDLYSLGCVLHAMVAGAPPYAGTDFQVMQAHVSWPVPQLPEYSATDRAVNQALVALMAKDPASRPATAGEAAAMLRRAASGAGGGYDHDVTELRSAAPAYVGESTLLRPAAVPASPPIAPVPAPRRTSRALVVGVGALALVAILGGGVAIGATLLNRDSDAPSETQAGATTPVAATPSSTPTPSPTPAETPTQAVASSAAPLPSVAPSPTPLGVPVGGQRDLACGSGYIVVLTSSAGSSPQATVQGALARFSNAPDRYYLDPYASCPNLRDLDGKVDLGLIPYMGTFASPVDACEARMDYLDTTTYVIGVDTGMTTATYCACDYADAALPLLNSGTDAEPTGDARFWVLELQYMLYDAGYNPQKLVPGKFGSQTTGFVAQLQADYGLVSTGSMDADTWSVLRALAC